MSWWFTNVELISFQEQSFPRKKKTFLKCLFGFARQLSSLQLITMNIFQLFSNSLVFVVWWKFCQSKVLWILVFAFIVSHPCIRTEITCFYCLPVPESEIFVAMWGNNAKSKERCPNVSFINIWLNCFGFFSLWRVLLIKHFFNVAEVQSFQIR